MASNFFNKASLVMVPDAPIDGKLPSVKPEDRSGDFTFSRGSNLAATRVNKSGLIEKGRENLLLQSNQFDTTWSSINASETSGQSGYDGTNNAWAFTDNTANDIHSLAQYGKWTTSVCTGSIYVKAGSLSKFYVSNGSSGIGVFFNLSNGSVEGVTGAVIAQSITSVGGDWYRLSVTMQSAGTFLIGTYQTFVSGDYNASIRYTGTGTGNIYIQDAQLEQGLVATEYIETTTAAVQKGILENLPRLDYSGGASCPSLLLEPQRTNILAYSEGMFDSSNFNQINGIAVTGQQTDLNGTNTAVKFSNFVQSSARLDYNTVVAAVDGKTYTYSAYYKGSGDIRINVSTSTGVGGAGEKTITLTDEWVRHSITTTFSSPTGNVKSHLAITRTANNDAEVYMCFAQIEEGGYPTSYIPTYGTSQTRSAEDTLLNDLYTNHLITASGGTWFLEIKNNIPLKRDAIGDFFIADTFNSSNNAFVFRGNLSSTRLSLNKRVSGSLSLLYQTTQDDLKIAIKWNGTSVDVFENGAKVVSASPFTATALNFFRGSAIDITKQIQQTLLFPTALTDDECIALTTI